MIHANGASVLRLSGGHCEAVMRQTKRDGTDETLAPIETRPSAVDRLAVDFVKLLRGRPAAEVEMLFIRVQSILRKTVPPDQARGMLQRYADLYERYGDKP